MRSSSAVQSFVVENMKVVHYQGLCFLGDQHEQPEEVGAWTKQLRSQHKIETDEHRLQPYI